MDLALAHVVRTKLVADGAPPARVLPSADLDLAVRAARPRTAP
jgi:acyl-CoA reductase-like NAD-dependent aldehyde dehydrogenase